MAVPAPDLGALQALGERIRPLSAAGERVLEAPEVLAALMPQRGLARGTTVAAVGAAATSVALALAGPSTATGSWVAVVGLPELGLAAASELGVDLERVLLVADPGRSAWPSTVAALLDAAELVLVRPPGPVSVGVQRRLTARARDRGSVLLQVGGDIGRWTSAPDLVVSASDPRWSGLGVGHGHLRARQVTVEVSGRRGAHRPRTARLWLPGPRGGISVVAPSVSVPRMPPTSVTARAVAGRAIPDLKEVV